MNEKWPPRELDQELAEIGRIILHYNSLEKHVAGVLRQMIADSFEDRAILVLCENLSNHLLEENLRSFAHMLHEQEPSWGLEEAVFHMADVFQDARNLRNRLAHEIANSLHGGKLHLHRHFYRKDGYSAKGLILTIELLEHLDNWLREANEYVAKVGIEISFLRGLRDRGPRWGWPVKVERLSWRKIEEEFTAV